MIFEINHLKIYFNYISYFLTLNVRYLINHCKAAINCAFWDSSAMVNTFYSIIYLYVGFRARLLIALVTNINLSFLIYFMYLLIPYIYPSTELHPIKS